MAAIQSLANASSTKTFGEWCDKFSAYVTSHFSDKWTRVDVVFDRYLPNSIKGGTRAKRKGGESRGIRRNVESRDQRIGNWERFTVKEDNKPSLAHFLSTEISRSYNAHHRRELVLSGGFSDILKVWSSDITRIVLHANDATERGHSQFYVAIQMSLSSYWHTGNIFVKTYGCFLELLEKRSTQLQGKRKRGSHC